VERSTRKTAARAKVASAFLTILAQQPFSSIRVTSVASNCQMSNQAFYRLYSNKYVLAIEVLSEQLESCITVSGNNATFRDLTLVILTIIKNNPRVYGNLLRDDEGVKLLPAILTKLSSDWTGFAPAWASNVIISAILVNWAEHRFAAPIEEIYQEILYNLPACEFLSEAELQQKIAQYEGVKLRDFSDKTVNALRKK